MRFEEGTINGILVVKVLESRIVADIAPQFKADLIAYVQHGNKRIILDLSDVTFIDSSGLGALIGTLKAVGSDGELVFCGAHGAVVSMFKLTRMDKVFRIFDSPAKAASALA
jgi:anti-sigma B factor antagonist